MSSPSPLNYAPRLPLHRRRSFLKWIVLLAVLSVAASGRWWEPPAWRHVLLLYWQHRCMVYTAPSDQLVFDSTQSIQIIPKEWSHFYSLFSPPGFFSQATIFMHEMKKPNGQKRLVVVDYTPWLFGGRVQLSRVFEPGTAFRWPKEFTHRRDLPISGVGEIKKVFAGHVDSADQSHFWFLTQDGNREMIYDGWLQNDESVIIGLRDSTTQPR